MSDVELRASDADRERVSHVLRDAAADGRLTLDELTSRLDVAYASRTRAELERLTDDLVEAPPAPPPRRTRKRQTVFAFMGGTGLRGRVRLAGTLRVVSFMGTALIDLRDAELLDDETTIVVVNVMGGVSVIVPTGVEVDAHDVIAIMGGRGVNVPPAPAGARRIRIKGIALMGGVGVAARRPRLQA